SLRAAAAPMPLPPAVTMATLFGASEDIPESLVFAKTCIWPRIRGACSGDWQRGLHRRPLVECPEPLRAARRLGAPVHRRKAEVHVAQRAAEGDGADVDTVAERRRGRFEPFE